MASPGNPMQVAAIVGSRHFNDYKAFKKVIDRYYRAKLQKILSGGAKGVDSMAKRYAKENNIPFGEFPAEWDKHGRAAGPIRNEAMVLSSDIVIAFLAPDSKGTRSTIGLCYKHGVDVEIFLIGKDGKLSESL